MTSLFRQPILVVLFFGLAWLTSLSALAKDVRFPESGVPAFTLVLPDDWSTQPAAQGNLLVLSPSRSAVLVLFIAASTDTLDKIAKEAMVTAPAVASGRKEPTEISGCEGSTWFGIMKNSTNLTLNLEMSIVRIDEGHVGSASLLLAETITPAEMSTARLVRNGIKLIRK